MKEYTRERTKWVEWFYGRSPDRKGKLDANCIVHQIRRMMDHAVTYRVLAEAVRMAPQVAAVKDCVQLNPFLYGMICQCFFESQSLAIRRLTEMPERELKGKEVQSLCKVLRDMRDNAALMTRHTVCKAEGLIGDPAVVRKRCSTRVSGHVDQLLSDSYQRHLEVDKLTGTAVTTRSSQDIVEQQIFDMLIQKLKVARSDVEKYVNKFVAHMATRGSRNRVIPKDFTIALRTLWRAQRAICQVAGFVGNYLIPEPGVSFGWVVQQHTQPLQHIHPALVAEDKVCTLVGLWNRLRMQADTWLRWKRPLTFQSAGKTV